MDSWHMKGLQSPLLPPVLESSSQPPKGLEGGRNIPRGGEQEKSFRVRKNRSPTLGFCRSIANQMAGFREASGRQSMRRACSQMFPWAGPPATALFPKLPPSHRSHSHGSFQSQTHQGSQLSLLLDVTCVHPLLMRVPIGVSVLSRCQHFLH